MIITRVVIADETKEFAISMSVRRWGVRGENEYPIGGLFPTKRSSPGEAIQHGE